MAKLMLVEDDTTMRSLLKTLLEIEGYEVIGCVETSKEKIINSIKENQPDMLILDVHLRGSNGLDIVKDLRQDNQTFDLPVLMSSGMAMEDQCLQAGANTFLLKPYMPDELIQKLRHYVN
ncbi:MAG: response regulator [Anaerolineaceae bacterium]|nr:response regulator [Anaerolineaceae bacterium]